MVKLPCLVSCYDCSRNASKVARILNYKQSFLAKYMLLYYGLKKFLNIRNNLVFHFC